MQSKEISVKQNAIGIYLTDLEGHKDSVCFVFDCVDFDRGQILEAFQINYKGCNQ